MSVRRHGLRAERIGRDGAQGVPADPVTGEHRAVDAGPRHPGLAVVVDDRQDTGHADADAARHRLLDRDLHRDAGAGVGLSRDLVDRLEHRHRPARVDDVGV
jgi:hypothetical protein